MQKPRGSFFFLPHTQGAERKWGRLLVALSSVLGCCSGSAQQTIRCYCLQSICFSLSSYLPGPSPVVLKYVCQKEALRILIKMTLPWVYVQLRNLIYSGQGRISIFKYLGDTKPQVQDPMRPVRYLIALLPHPSNLCLS